MNDKWYSVRRGFSFLAVLLFIGIPTIDVLAISLGDRVQTTATLNVRASAAGTAIGQQSSGSQGVTIGGPTTATLNGTSYTWWNVDFDSGVDGWVAAEAGLIAIVPAFPTSPKQLTGMTHSNGVISFVLKGPVGSTYVIEVASNLDDWLPISTNMIPANGLVTILDPNMTIQPQRFYRAVREP